ncbi:uncharacterized protein LOC126317506 [Schistocerca gregaria]|uniref:uncharacterized protein LOC126317506 n=1 Tax=Schistocerca gregaria TaxID=7010 RepID=UPI00211DEB48|nr:uncharacterized protein LOC126317506 [Schistocerca gregaria]
MHSAHYKPKNILITGGAGFVLHRRQPRQARLLLQPPLLRTRQLAPDLPLCTRTSLSSRAPSRRVLTGPLSPQGNILSTELVSSILDRYNIDTIMHFAAQSHVDSSFGNSLEFTKNNVLGTHVLLECCRLRRISRFIHASTDEVYGESASNNLTCECSLLAPTNPYAASKAAAEQLVHAYFKSFKLPLLMTRSNNIYGPHQYPEKLIPKFICRLERNLQCCIHGNGSARRCFLYISDAVNAFDLVLHKGVAGHVYNIESKDELTVSDVATRLLSLYGLQARADRYILHTPDRLYNDMRYHIDGKKLQKLGFVQKISIDEGLRLTIQWYKNTNLNLVWQNVDSALHPHPIANDSKDQGNPRHRALPSPPVSAHTTSTINT